MNTYIWYANEEICVNVCTVSLKVLVRLDFHLDHQITSCTTHPCVSFLRYSKIYTVINTFWNVYRLSDGLVNQPFSTAAIAWVTNHATDTITISANLLDHEWALANGLETCTCTSAAFALTGSWLRFGTFACSADICTTKVDSFL